MVGVMEVPDGVDARDGFEKVEGRGGGADGSDEEPGGVFGAEGMEGMSEAGH